MLDRLAVPQDPMLAALGKLTDIMDALTADKRKKKSTLEAALDGARAESVSSGAAKRSAIARRALMKSLTSSPHKISQNIEKLMMDNLFGRTRTPNMPEPALSARAWVVTKP